MSPDPRALGIAYIDLSALARMCSGNFMDEGTGRSIYYIPEDYVLKVAKNKKGLIENENEHYIYQTIAGQYRENLCPVVRYEGKFLVMPKATSMFETPVNFDEVMARNLPFIRYLQKTYDLNELDLVYPDNWGLYKGKFVLFDYGSTYIKRLTDSSLPAQGG